MRPAEDEFAEAFGQDSFLDVLTNVVGIIILLVLMVGLRASHDGRNQPAVQQASFVTSAEPKPDDALKNAYHTAAYARRNLQDLMHSAAELRDTTNFRAQERDYLATFVAAFEHELNQRRAELDVEQQRTFDTRRQLVEAQQSLDKLTREQIGLLSQSPDVHVIENQPTPLSQSSLGKELFLQLADGFVAVVPVEELFNEVRRDGKDNLWRLKDSDSFVQTIGPIDGFRMRYVVEKRTVSVKQQPGSVQTGTIVELAQELVIPVSSPTGVPVDQALAPDSDMWRHLRRMNPSATVVAIAVYPDSIDELHTLKHALIAAGYSISELPMETGQPIGFSRHGQKIVAQ